MPGTRHPAHSVTGRGSRNTCQLRNGKLRPGDWIVVDRADGTQAIFEVDRVERHAKDDFPTDEVSGDIDHAGLRLVTCGGAFDENTGDYLDNVIVFASLSSVR